jgi:hypothetical protein
MSRTVSELGSPFGTAIAGTSLVSVIALIVVGEFGFLGMIASLRIPTSGGPVA